MEERVLADLADWLIDANVTVSIDGQIWGVEELLSRYREERAAALAEDAAADRAEALRDQAAERLAALGAKEEE